ncbi:MAG: tetratricopeptide repeat protein [Cyanobacteria bacterium J06607_13]
MSLDPQQSALPEEAPAASSPDATAPENADSGKTKQEETGPEETGPEETGPEETEPAGSLSAAEIALRRLNSPEKRAQAEAELAQGQALFERGRYKRAIAHFQTALSLSNPMGSKGGEIQLWLVNTYIAAGDEEAGKALCRKLILHPDLDTKQQSKRILYILEAPELEMKPEWVTKIPDLGGLDDDSQLRYVQRPKKKRRRKPKPEPEPIDLSQVNTADNQFVWIALAGILLTLGGLFWFS